METYLTDLNKGLKLPPELRKDVLDEIGTHIHVLSMGKGSAENIIGDAKELSKSINKSKDLSIMDYLKLRSTLKYFAYFFVINLTLSALSQLITGMPFMAVLIWLGVLINPVSPVILLALAFGILYYYLYKESRSHEQLILSIFGSALLATPFLYLIDSNINSLIIALNVFSILGCALFYLLLKEITRAIKRNY